ncbi:AEC family transporter [Nocardioides bruguierae]|uniref:AEC family transporter n=1 Tax=Nocardioides bruguierae TaxID=2945102 RepID=A0A9X2DAP0_9ACTN|nr:AEC family transporter [Nocardioides bruguierae]MCM0621149.1 AEC family transporter [Nocardioides bruguierae]
MLEGFGTVGVVIALGALLAHLGVLDLHGQKVLSTVSFLVATPALLVVTLQGNDVSTVFSAGMIAVAAGVVATIVGSVLVSWRRKETMGEGVVGVMAATYGNTGNLGLPIATYVLGSAVLVAPTMLFQLILLQPAILTLLDAARSERRLRVSEVLLRPVRNPITIGAFVGIAMVVLGWSLPGWLGDPVDLIGNLAVPCMLLAYGVSLRLGPLPGRGVAPSVLWGRVGMKLLLQPLVTYLTGHYLLGLDGAELLAVVVLSALPTAQNTFVIATRYGTGQVMARDVIFVSTLLSVPAIALIAWLLS